MDKLPFFTEQFYNDPYLTKNVINELLDSEFPKTFDYQFSPGLPVDHLTFCADIPEVERELKKLISDMPAYLEYQTKTHWEPEDQEIPLNALLMHYSSHFPPLIWKKSMALVKHESDPKSRKEVSNG